MDTIQDLFSAFWLFSPIGVAILVGLTALLLTGVPARLLEFIQDTRWTTRIARFWPAVRRAKTITAR